VLTTVVLTMKMGDEIIITGSLPYILDELAACSVVSVLRSYQRRPAVR